MSLVRKFRQMQCRIGDNPWACQLRVDGPSYGLPNSIGRHDRTGFCVRLLAGRLGRRHLLPTGMHPSRAHRAARRLNKPIVGMAATPDGGGYWLVGSDGGIFAYGDAPFEGSPGGTPLNKPIVGMAATPDGGGYWLVGLGRRHLRLRRRPLRGLTGRHPLNKPIVGMAATPDGGGYWLVGLGRRHLCLRRCTLRRLDRAARR